MLSPQQATWSSNSDTDEDISPLRCWDCNVNFTNKTYLYKHLFHHIKQPVVVLERAPLPPLKITLKSKSGNNFEIVSSPQHRSSPISSPDNNEKTPTSNLAVIKEEIEHAADEEVPQKENAENKTQDVNDALENQMTNDLDIDESILSPNFVHIEEINRESPSQDQENEENVPAGNSNSESNTSDYGSIPGAEPTPPPEPAAVEYPKIRIKTTGLLKESLTITEITDDNPEGDPGYGNSNSESNTSDYGSIPAEPTPPPESNNADYPKIRIKTSGLLKEPFNAGNFDPNTNYTQNTNSSNLWPSNSNIEDPLKLPENDDNNILSLFNNNERAKDLGFHSSDSEYISLDRLEDRNRGAMQLYNPPTSQNSSPLDSLTGLPMQALAQQVSRLQSSSSGMHQQNVLINIQQFPSGPPPQPSYQPPPLYPYPQPMHQPYQYQQSYRPPNPMYYPPGPPGYPPQHMPPPPPQPQMPPQMGQPPMSQPQMNQPPMGQNQMPPMSQSQMPPTSSQQQQQSMNQQMQQQSSTPYRQPMPVRQPAPRPPQPGNRMPSQPRPPMAQRQPVTRPRAPMVRPRSSTGMTAVRSVRPRMSTPPNGIRPQTSPMKRTPNEQNQQLQAKKKKFEFLTPDKDDDDCQVICMQPKNTDGGLPQIESVQGGTSEPAESSIMHLSDSITLSVRNPPPKPAEAPKKSDAKAVANILATRGITVTATAKPKETVKESSPTKPSSPIPAALNLNGAVSIIPASKTNGNAAKPAENLPTVDLTDDSPTSTTSAPSPQQKQQRPGLPYRCDLCPAQYPNAVGLNKHRQTYHKTHSGMAELGIPVVNLKTPGVMQKLSSLGICNYIPLPSQGGDGTFAVPIINTRNATNVSNIGCTTMISLGPIRSIPKPQNNNVHKPASNVQKS